MAAPPHTPVYAADRPGAARRPGAPIEMDADA